jgi:hypothetical protein
MPIELIGRLWGQHVDRAGTIVGEIVHVMSGDESVGPAENAFVYVELLPNQKGRARYISWINYYDIEYANRKEPGNWRVIEPQEATARIVDWYPYGWSGPLLPNVAYDDTSIR